MVLKGYYSLRSLILTLRVVPGLKIHNNLLFLPSEENGFTVDFFLQYP